MKTTSSLSFALWLAVTALLPASAGAQDFAYFGELGPSHWGDLEPGWEMCGRGQRQSPVDFRRADPERWRRLPVRYGSTAGEIFSNGHTIEVETHGDNRLRLGGVDYSLVQFHFHVASEHRVFGRGHDMELHLVHRAADGTLAVIGVFLQRGSTSGALSPIFDHLPDDVGVHHELDAAFDPSDFLPLDATHYRYLGSLTTPPCSEGVRWMVLTTPMPVSDEHLAQFAERIHFNARPVKRKL